MYDKNGKIYVPEDQALHLDIDIVKLHHDTPITGHPGRENSLELVQELYLAWNEYIHQGIHKWM